MKFISMIIFSLLSFCSFAHQDIVYSINKGNIHLQYLSGWDELEIGRKINIFVELSDKLIKEKFHSSEQIYIYFGHDYTKSDTSYYALGFGQFTFWDYEKSKFPNDIKSSGIKLIIKDRDFDIKKILELFNSAYLNIDFIKANQSDFIIKTRFTIADTVKSIPFNQVKKYLFSTDNIVEKLLNEKIYRNLKKVKEKREIDYYFQNNKFHFYDTQEPDEEVLLSQGKEILTVNNIFEIFGSVNYGYFVFINESSFYYIPQQQNKVIGPFTIDSIRVGRPPIYKYYHEYKPINKFILCIDNYSNSNKVLFIPDSNLLISNYHKLENDFIKNLLIKKKNIKNNKSNITAIILLTILCLSFVLNIWLLYNKKMTASSDNSLR